MLLPGIRLVERPGALHFFDGRRVVSLSGDESGRAAIRCAAGDHSAGGATEQEIAEARELLVRLQLSDPAPAPASDPVSVPIAAQFASALVGGWTRADVAAERLRDTTVYVWDGPDGGLRTRLRASGLTVRRLSGAAEIADLDPARSLVAVVAADERPVERLQVANEACLAGGLSWLPVGGYDGAVLRVGPLLIPGETACAECLLRRLAANVAYTELYGEIVEAPAAPTPVALRDWGHSIAGLVLLTWIANRDDRLPGRLFTLVPEELTVRQASVFRVPRCPACAAPDYVSAAAPWGSARDH